jgi:uncharacterized glyoxalase superfamily protein PhnB
MSTDAPAKIKHIVNRSAPAASIIPVLVYGDVDKMVVWLCDAFGFTERLRMTVNDGKIAHAQLSFGSGAIMIGRVGREFQAPRAGEVNQYVVVHVDDVQAHLQQAQRMGARIVQPLTDMPFGERQYTAEDPGGHRWTFSQSIADVAPEAWGAKVTDQQK